MEWTPYTGPVVDLAQPHYHAWILGEHGSGLAYFPAMRPYHNRATARNRGRTFANPEHGTAGVMVLKCDGNPSTCPAFEQTAPAPTVDPIWDAFEKSGAKALLDTWAKNHREALNDDS